MRVRIALAATPLLAALLVGQLAVAASSHRKTVRVNGTITALSTTAITVTSAKGEATTCAIPSGEPLVGFALQQRVQMRCRRSGDTLVLTPLRHARVDDGDDEDEHGGGHRGRH